MSPLSKLARLGVVVAVVILFACTKAPSPDTASQTSTSLPIQGGFTSTTGPQEPQRVQGVGEPFMLGNLQLTILSVQDPFASTVQVQPAAGNRLVSIRYQVVSTSSSSRDLSGLPAVQLRDSTGAEYRSQHGRASVIGSQTPGEFAPGERMETNAVFEVSASATGLRVTFLSSARPGAETAVVNLD
jgi:hypothetical protein